MIAVKFQLYRVCSLK